ncbi:MAG: 4-hydroxy-tetrahydrodipicolinate reductase [Gammaproteobacteria bacterium]
MKEIRIGIAGASGRMGQAVRRAIDDTPGLELASTLTRGGNLKSLVERCDVVVDFSRPDLLADLAAACGAARRPLVSGTTGLDDAALEVLRAAAKLTPIVYAANFSIGITLLRHLVEKTSETLSKEWTCEIFDAHHKHKVDAPSGTALALGSAADRPVEYAVERSGETVGFHEVRFAGPGERVVLGHEALDRTIFARGALRAARWVVGNPPGFYGMHDVLALKSR